MKLHSILYDKVFFLIKVMSNLTSRVWGLPDGSDGKQSACNTGRSPGSILGLGRALGEGNGNPL